MSYFVTMYDRGRPVDSSADSQGVGRLVAPRVPSLRRAGDACRRIAVDRPGGRHRLRRPDAGGRLSGRRQRASTAGTGMVSVLVGGHAKEIALGALAVMSLFMASMMVRKGQPAPVPAVAAANRHPCPGRRPSLMAGEPLAGEAGSRRRTARRHGARRGRHQGPADGRAGFDHGQRKPRRRRDDGQAVVE